MKLRLTTLFLTAALLTAAPCASALSGSLADIGAPSGLSADGEAVLATDVFNKVVWRIKDDTAELYAGSIAPSLPGREPAGAYADGSVNSARFLEPWAIAPYRDGYALTDAAANVVRFISDGSVSTAAGSGASGSMDGNDISATFDRPTGLAAGENGCLYVADTGGGKIRRVSDEGIVTTVAAGLSEPTGLFWDNGALYIAETGAHRIVCLKGDVLKTVTGSDNKTAGYADGSAADALFESPQGVAAANGAVFIADTGNNAVRCLKNGRVSTIAIAGDEDLTPVKPRGLLIISGADGERLLTADVFSGQLIEYDTAKSVESKSAASVSGTYAEVSAEASGQSAIEGADGKLAGAVVMVSVKTAKNARLTTLTLTREIRSGLTDESSEIAGFTVHAGDCAVTLNKKALSMIDKAAKDKDALLTIRRASGAEQKGEAAKAIGKRPTIEISVSYGGKALVSLGKSGRFIASVPYEPDENEHTAARVLKNSGELVYVNDATCDETAKTLSFSASALGVYGIAVKQPEWNA